MSHIEARSVRSVHKFGYGHKFEGEAAVSVVAGGAQARDCGGIVSAGSVSVGRGAAIRGEQQSGVRMA